MAVGLSRRSLLLSLAAPPVEDLLVLRLADLVFEKAGWSSGIDSLHQPGSLWKPFLAASWQGVAPRFRCEGGCWSGRRHGSLGLAGALAVSCNRYFDQLVTALGLPELNASIQAFGLPEVSSLDWAHWQTTPRRLALAYAELLARRSTYSSVMAGMRQAALLGTAKALGRGYLGKTGTSASRLGTGDGWVFAAWPVDLPARLALFRSEGRTGAAAAGALRARLDVH